MSDNADQPQMTEADRKEFGERLLAQAFDLWFNPELKRRTEAGLLPNDFALFAAQVLFPPEGENLIRLNGEMTGVMLVVAQRAVEKGEQLMLSDLAEARRYELDDADMDCGHFTIIRRGVGWMIDFNFRSGRTKAADMLRLADQYQAAAVACVKSALEGPAVDNLFSACELAAKAELILHRSSAVKAKTHNPLKSAINAWGRLRNIDPAFVAIFNLLGQQRADARYKGAEAAKGLMPSTDDLDLVKAVIDRGLWQVGRATDCDRHGEPETA
ncbi:MULTISPECIES: hypothetical protein [unclassified Sphingomonas]|uniref:hypothetical protein n=1 Tax=unclassified Sphingomonas TaxID=196159 RepID=UPI00226A8B3E|nr:MULTISPECIES: hypothetical protein [unclassified Sphingomonas]